MAYRTIIVEDNEHAINTLKSLLQPHAEDIELVGEARNGPEAVALINSLRPDLVFLDIVLPGMDGFQVLEELEESPLVIMITAHQENARKAFDTNAIGFLDKPFDPDDVGKVIQKLKRVSPLPHQVMTDVQFPTKETREFPLGIGCKVGKTKLFFSNEEIFFFQSELKYTTVVTRSGRYCMETPLKILAIRLDPTFMQIHRSHIVNLKQVKGIRSREDGKPELILKDSPLVLPVSDRHLDKLRSLWI